MAEIVTRKEFATRAGVSGAAITKACRPGGILEAAKAGRRIDASHPTAVEYLAKHEEDAPAPAKRPKAKKPRKKKPAQRRKLEEPSDDEDIFADDDDSDIFTARRSSGRRGAGRRAGVDNPSNVEFQAAYPVIYNEKGDPIEIEDMAHLTLEHIVRTYGTQTGLKDFLDSTKRLREIAEKDLKMAIARGNLVSRELVARLFSIHNESNARILDDGPSKLAVIIHAMIPNKPSKQELEDLIRKELSREVRAAKTKTTRAINKMGGKNATARSEN